MPSNSQNMLIKPKSGYSVFTGKTDGSSHIQSDQSSFLTLSDDTIVKLLANECIK